MIRLFFLLVCSAFFPLSVSAQCCDYTLVMNDSYGDGWNGATLELFLNGNSQGLFAAEGNSSSASLEVCNGDELYFVYSPGDYENENTFFLAGGNGNLIVQDGPEPFVGTSEVFVVDCDLEAAPGSSPCSAFSALVDECVEADNTTFLGSGYVGNCANFNGGDLWFSVVVPESGSLIFLTESVGELNDTGLQIWTGDSCNELEAGPCNDDGGSNYFSLITAYGYEPGSTVYIQAWGYGGQTGAFNFCVSDPGVVELVASELPIFSFETGGQQIPDEPKVDALLEVRYNGPGELNDLSDDPLEYNGHVGIEVRGATSSGYPQTPYLFETRTELGANNNVSLLGFPQENDWNLLSNTNDKSLIRNMLAQHLFEKMGNYAPRTSLVEVIIDSLYQGVYTFCEKIKVDAGRVDIATLNPEENEGDDVTGGYILELNYHNSSNSWELSYSPLDHPEFDVHLVYRYPKPEEITQPQKDYIAAFIDSMETALYGPDFADPEVGYRQFLDIESFIDYFLINELSRNNDGFKKSRYFHKDKYSNGGKFKAGPTWDFDWAWKDLWTCTQFENQDGSGWAHLINTCPTDNYSPDWYIRMLQDTTYANHMRCRYEEYRADFLNMEYVQTYVDSIHALVDNAQQRHYQKWPFWGLPSDAPEIEPLAQNYAEELNKLTSWVELRLNWLDDNLPGTCWGPIISVPEQVRGSATYPNPSSGRVFFDQSDEPYTHLEVWDVQGQLIGRQELGRTALQSILLEPGIYFLKFYQSKLVVKTEKVFITG